jgi:hypothetical protein
MTGKAKGKGKGKKRKRENAKKKPEKPNQINPSHLRISERKSIITPTPTPTPIPTIKNNLGLPLRPNHAGPRPSNFALPLRRLIQHRLAAAMLRTDALPPPTPSIHHVQRTEWTTRQMVRDIQTQQGFSVDVLVVGVLVRARFADVCAHDRLLVAFRVVVAGGEGRLAEARDGGILFFDVVAVGEEDGFVALGFAEVGEGALEWCVGCYAGGSRLARDGRQGLERAGDGCK